MTDSYSFSAPRDQRVAVIGLGRMGSAFATRLLDAGVPLAVYNRTASKAAPFVERGAVLLNSLADAGQCGTVLSMVIDESALADLHGPKGIFSTETVPDVWIESSTVSVDAATRAAAIARDAGTHYVSGPVSGNPGVVLAGNAIFAISGAAPALDRAEEVLGRIGRAVYRVGDEAQANVVKLCVNALLAVVMQSLAEIAVLGERAGLTRAALMEVLNDSAVGSPFTRYKTAAIVGLDFTPAFTPEGQRKDIRLALDLAQQHEVPMPVLNTTEVAYSRLISGGLGEGRDFSALLLEVARDAGLELRVES